MFQRKAKNVDPPTDSTNATNRREGPDGRSGRGPLRPIVFVAIAVLGITADLWTKAWAFRTYGFDPDEYSKIHWWGQQAFGEVFGIQTSVNHGALFGLGQGGVNVFCVLAIIAVVGVTAWYFIGRPKREWWLTVALGSILGGIAGNLFDRLGMPALFGMPETGRGVRDWIVVMLGSYHWPNFNIADSMLVCGAIMLILHALFTSPDGKKKEVGSG